MELLKEAKDIVGFLPSAEVLKRTLKEFIAREKAAPRSVKPTKPANRQIQANSPQVEPVAATVSKLKPQSRYIPKSVAHKVRERDQYQCTFISPTGRRCTEKRGLELDHIKAFAQGGSSEASNLRLLCPAHNQLHAETTFGREKIESYFQR
jgi:5-methylcytosine-specific restriction endonuclease McrA